MELDAADWTIVRELLRWDVHNYPQGPLRAPVKDIARRVGLHPARVRSRLAALRKSGVYEGSVFEPRPETLGLVRAGYLVRFAEDATHPGLRDAASLEALASAFPGVSFVGLYRGAIFAHVWAATPAQADAVAKRLSKELDAAPPVRHYAPWLLPAPSPGDLSPLDWRIVLALRAHPGAALSEIARECRVATRTVERRLRRAMDEACGAMLPRIRLARVEGTALCQFMAHGPRAREELAAAFPERIQGPLPPGVVASVAVPLPSVAEAERRRHDLAARPGVGTVELLLARDLAYPTAFEAWLRDLVANVTARARQDEVPRRAPARAWTTPPPSASAARSSRRRSSS